MRRRERMGLWREVRLCEKRTPEYVCISLGTYIHREVPTEVVCVFSEILRICGSHWLNDLDIFSQMGSESIATFSSKSI